MPTLIAQSQQRLMRWKNGGGMTCEVMRFPPDSSLESFDWRVSVATVQQGGAFSSFPGVDRSLAILEGHGIQLEIAGQQQLLRPTDPALSFAGETPVQATLHHGAVRDFNVMTRRAACHHTLENISLTHATWLRFYNQSTLLYVIRGSCQLAQQYLLQAGDAMLFGSDEKACLCDPRNASAQLMLVRLQPGPARERHAHVALPTEADIRACAD